MSKSNSESSLVFNRREALLSATATVAAVAAAASSSDVTTVQAAGASCSTPRSAVAKTQYGKVRGYVEDGVLTFKGVPYGANTGGENRWLPAKPPKSYDLCTDLSRRSLPNHKNAMQQGRVFRVFFL